MNDEEFEGIAYAYRSWPMTDPSGVVARFAELKKYVEEEIANAIDLERQNNEYFIVEHYYE